MDNKIEQMLDNSIKVSFNKQYGITKNEHGCIYEDKMCCASTCIGCETSLEHIGDNKERKMNEKMNSLRNIDEIVVVREPIVMYKPRNNCLYSRKVMYRPEHHNEYIDSTISIDHIIVPKIKDVKFNDPATIVFWEDGTKTVVKCHDEFFDPEKGLAMAISKKALGNNGSYFNVFTKYIKDGENLVTSISKAFSKLANIIRGGGNNETETESIKQEELPFFGTETETVIVDDLWEDKSKEVTDRIRTMLYEHGMTQAQLAKELEVSPSTVSRYLNCKRDMDIYVLSKISTIFDVDLDWLLTGTGTYW